MGKLHGRKSRHVQVSSVQLAVALLGSYNSYVSNILSWMQIQQWAVSQRTLTMTHPMLCHRLTEQQVGRDLGRSPAPKGCSKEGQHTPACPGLWPRWVLSVFRVDISYPLQALVPMSDCPHSDNFLPNIRISQVATCVYCLLSCICAPRRRCWLCFLSTSQQVPEYPEDKQN